MKKVWKILLLPVAVCCLCLHGAAAAGLLEAGSRCVNVLVPSLYLFTILASLAASSGLLTSLRGRGALWAMLLFSQIGGYPVGAQLVTAQRDSLEETLRRRMLCICFGSGPAFLLGTVCRGLSPGATAVMMGSVILPQLLLGGILLHRARASDLHREQLTAGFPQLLTGSVEKASAAMLKICGMVLLFGAVSGMLRESGVLPALAGLAAGLFGCTPETADACLTALLDVSAVGEYLRMGGSLPMAAALLSFGGICVHLQIASLTDGALPWAQFLTTRVISAGMAWLFCSVGLRICCHGDVAVSLPAAGYAPHPDSGNPAAVLCLLVMSVMVLMQCPGKPKSCNRLKNNPMKFPGGVNK